MIEPQFAPAAYSSLTELRTQIQHFAEDDSLQSFAKAVPDILLILNHNRQVVFANQKLVDFIGSNSMERILGARLGDLLGCIHVRECEGGCGTSLFCGTCGAVKATLNGLAGKADEQECRILRANGNEALDLRVWATPLQNGGSNQHVIFFAVKDISDEKRRQALESIFFHDVLNTASALRLLVNVVQQAPVDDQELPELRNDLSLVTERLIDEIQAQAELARAESHQIIPDFVRLNALQLLAEVVKTCQRYEFSQGKTLVIDTVEEDLMLVSDRTLLRRVLGNLAKNALEASGRGEQVRLGCEKAASGVRFWVQNPACMPREVQLQVFQRSFSTKGKGRGLGTYSIKLLGEHYLQGKVKFSSSVETGTIFEIWLPRKK